MKLLNTTGKVRVFNLSHDTYCRALRACACRRVPTPVLPGRRAVAGRLACASLTLPPGVPTDVNAAVLAVPEIERAVRAGMLRASE